MASNVSNAKARFFDMLKDCRRKSYDGRHFYRPDDIRAWMLAKDENQVANVAHLLQAVSSRNTFPPRLDDIQSAMVVFAVLVSIECGDLLADFVQFFGDDDLNKRIPDGIIDALQRSSLRAPAEVPGILSRFEQHRWAFAPAKMESIHRQKTALIYGHHILPFCKKERAGSGGTAVVYKVLIQDDLIPDTLRIELAGSEMEDQDCGKCYRLAVKSYNKPDWEPYKTERNTFQGIRKIQGVVKYLGSFEYDGSGGDDLRNYNILLEYGDQDLEEYLADAYPPVLNSEIINFWKKIFRVADTLQNFHNFEYERPDGVKTLFDGWHGDIKPSNILFVQQQFKLADFGYAKFEANSREASPATEILGVTYTYGAPECDPGRLRKKTSTKHTQEIDTWSFGCVLSSVATWVVLGSFAYDQYREFRKRAISNLLAQRTAENNFDAPKAHDRFHDGHDVLQAVKDWHQYLRNSMRRSDTITGKVLDLVEKKMLLADPQERLSSKALVQRLEKLVGVAKYEYSAAVKDDQVPNISQDMLKALLDLDYRVACNTGTDDHRRTTRAMAREQTQRTTRANKTERLDEMIVPAKVAGRQEVLESMLGETIGDRDHLYESPALDGTDHDMPVPEARQLPSPKVPHAKPATSHAIHSDQTVQQQPAVPAFQYSRNRGFDIPSSPPTYSETPVTHGQAAHIPNFFRPVQDPREESNTPSRRGTITAQPPTNPGSSPEPGGTILSTEVPQRRPLLRLPSMRTGQSALSNEAQFDLYPIGELRRRLCSLWERESKGAIFGLLKGKVPQDPRLKDFIKDRDIIFLVDNGWNMRPHWTCTTKVLEALAMQIGPLDDNGLDLWFTIGDKKRKNVRGFAIQSAFREAMAEVKAPDNSALYQTSMAQSLHNIFKDYQTTMVSSKKKLTLIILTTGEWEMGEPDDVENVIVDTIRKLSSENQHFWIERQCTIQFVSFGDNQQALERLQSLDDHLGARFNIPDVIDTEPWTGDPNKMLLGSIKSSLDGQETPDMRTPLSPEGHFSLSSQSASSANMDLYMHNGSTWGGSRSPSPRPSSQHTSSKASIRKSVRSFFHH